MARDPAGRLAFGRLIRPSDRETLMRRRSSAAGLLAALLLLPGSARAADAPYTGTWKVVVPLGDDEKAWFIIRVEDKGAGPTIALVWANKDFKEVRLQAEKPKGSALRFTAEAETAYQFVAYPPPGDKYPEKMLGSVAFHGFRVFVRLERTEEKEIDATQVVRPTWGKQDLGKALKVQDAKRRAAALKEVAEKYPGSWVAYAASLGLVDVLPATGAREEDVKASAENAIGFAAKHGSEMKAVAVAQIVQRILGTKKAPALAVHYPREMEKQLPADAPPGERIAVLKPLKLALRQANRENELREVSEQVEKLEKPLDDEYLKNAVPFKVEPFTRRGPARRVVLVELFTGVQCGPCVAADIAFDAALKAYQSRDANLLQYHSSFAGPDPLDNADAAKRAGYYGIGGTPETFVSGGPKLALGGDKAAGQDRYAKLAKAIQEKLASEASAKIRLTVKQTGDDLVMSVAVSDLASPGADDRLRLALIEEAVRFPGRNGQRIHHHVVRAMPGGADGFALEGATAKQEIKIDLAALRKSLADDPIDLKHLAVVAFIQNDKTREVLQATQADFHTKK
jgi:hypothetical protein